MASRGPVPPGEAGPPARYITPEALMELRFRDRERPIWDVAVLCFRGRHGSGALVQKLGARPVGRKVLYALEESSEHPHVYEAAVGGSAIVVVAGCLWGGPQTAILVEELACLGVRSVIGYGVAGSLVADLPKGTQVVAASGIVTDGTSRAYTTRPVVHPDEALAAAARAVADRVDPDVSSVTIATVDALYRETEADVRRWRRRGARAINMETAPLYAASSACGVPSVWLGHISDSLASPRWESWERPAAMTDVTVAVTVALIEELAGRA
jgi:uridine phosphorylase